MSGKGLHSQEDCLAETKCKPETWHWVVQDKLSKKKKKIVSLKCRDKADASQTNEVTDAGGMEGGFHVLWEFG